MIIWNPLTQLYSGMQTLKHGIVTTKWDGLRGRQSQLQWTIIYFHISSTLNAGGGGVSRIARVPWENQGNRVILSHSSSLSAHFTQESPSSHMPHLIAAQPYRFQSPGFQTKHERSIYKNRIINTKRKHRESSKLLLRPELHKQTLHNSLVAGAPSLCLK